MAHVDRDRGQLILVTGLLIAVAMVSLVLLLNTAIFTENLASRGADQSGREAVEYQATVVDGVGGFIDEENRREHQSQTAVEDNVTESIELIDNYTARSYATGGTVVRINDSTVTAHGGKLIRHSDDAMTFRNETGGRTDWQLSDDVEDARGFTLDVDDTNLVDTEIGEADFGDSFHVLVDGTDDWELYVYDNASTGDISVATATPPSGPTYRCSSSEPRAVIDPMAGTVNGEPCPGLEWAEGVSGDYDVAFRNGGNANGTYDLTINSTTAVNGSNVYAQSVDSTSPYHVPAVYSTTFEIHYRGPTLDYRSEVRVAPGESE